MERRAGPLNDPWLLGGSLSTITAPPRRPDAAAPWPTTATVAPPPASTLFPAPPRPDRPGDPLPDYVRGSYVRGALVLLGCMVAGLVVGYATMASRAPWGFGAPSGTPFVSFTVAGIWLHNIVVVCLPILLFPLLFWAPAATAGLTGYSIGRLTAAWLGLHLPGSL